MAIDCMARLPRHLTCVRRLAARVRTWALLLGALLGACNSNFIPVPPPGDPTFEPVQVSDATGVRQLWQVSGAPGLAMRNARVYVFNSSLEVGVIAVADDTGSYTSGLLDGNPGDRVELHYETPDGEKSPSVCRLLVEGISRTPCP